MCKESKSCKCEPKEVKNWHSGGVKENNEEGAHHPRHRFAAVELVSFIESLKRTLRLFFGPGLVIILNRKVRVLLKMWAIPSIFKSHQHLVCKFAQVKRA